MASLFARLQSPRSFTAFFLLGLLVAAVVTVPLTAGGEGTALGPLFVCTIQSVPEPEFPRVLFTVAIEPVPFDVWNPSVTLLPFVALLLLAWSITCRDWWAMRQPTAEARRCRNSSTSSSGRADSFGSREGFQKMRRRTRPSAGGRAPRA